MTKINVLRRPATKPQLKLIDELLIDTGRWDKRKVFLKSRYGFNYYDELSMAQASELITSLIEDKSGGDVR